MDYSKSLETTASTRQVYEALTNDLRNWWSDDLSITDNSFTIGFGETKKSFRVSNAVCSEEGFTVIWHCTQANLLHPEVKTPDEWVGTDLCWIVRPSDAGNKVTLTHVGLNASLECHEICIGGWDFFFLDSLNAYLSTGQGKPFMSSEAA